MFTELDSKLQGTKVVFQCLFLPPANEVCEGYVFTGVSLSTGEGGVCLWSGGMSTTHTPPWADTSQVDTPSGQTLPWADYPPPGRQPPLPGACWDTH